MDRVRGDIKEKEPSGRKCTTELHGRVYRRISTPHKSGNKMKRKIMKKIPYYIARNQIF